MKTRIGRIMSAVIVLSLLLAVLSACAPGLRTIVYTVLPNETAYLLPSTETDKQAQISSEEYLAKNQVRAKQIVITFSPYTRKSNPGTADDYAHKADNLLVLVDRTPQTREWTKAVETGTEGKNQAIEVETAEAIDFTIGITCTGQVQEVDAAKFLFHFQGSAGVSIDENDKDELPPAIYRSASVAAVMDKNVRGAFQAGLFREFHKLGLDDARKNVGTILDTVTKETVTYFKDRGLTLTNCGGQGGMSFSDPEVQKSINARFIALQQSQAERDKAVAQQEAADARLQAQVSDNKRLLAEAEGKAAADKAAKQPEIDYYAALVKLCRENPGIDCAQLIAATKYQGGVPQYAPYPQYPGIPVPSAAPAPSPSPTPTR